MNKSNNSSQSLLERCWSEKFPPLNLYNFPIKMISGTDINDYKNAGYVQPSKAIKFDSEKARLDLVDADAVEGLAKVLGFGAKKYAANNWRQGMNYSRVIAALLRHCAAMQRGEDIDPESGLPHIDHLGCCWMFLSNYTKHEEYKEFDDRWKRG